MAPKTAVKNAVVWKVDGTGTTQYLVEFNRQYPGDSRFSQNLSDAKRFTYKQAWQTATKLNNGLDRGVPKRYGYGTV